jgi:hypothetical protein
MARRVLTRLPVIALVGLLAAVLTAGTALAASGFQVLPSPNVTGSNFNELDGVASVSPTEAWSVGFSRVNFPAPFRALIEHRTASGWSIVASAQRPAADDTRLHGVAAVSTSDVWAVGSDTGASGHSLIERWNGSAWSAVAGPAAEPAGAELKSIAAISANNIWAVGDFNAGGGFQTLIEHFNGSTWQVMPGAPILLTGHDFLSGVAGSGPNDVWAVGRTFRHPVPIIEHFDGKNWSQFTQSVSGYNSSLNSVSVVNATDAWAVGTQNLSDTVTEHWDGKAWTLVHSPFPTANNAQNDLTGVVALGRDNVWAVGQTLSNFSSLETLAEHWDGTAWSTVGTPDPTGQDILSATAGSGFGQALFAVGNSNDQKTLVLQTTG